MRKKILISSLLISALLTSCEKQTNRFIKSVLSSCFVFPEQVAQSDNL